MKHGMLSDLFRGVAAKRLTPVETGKQHEFQGIQPLRQFMGDQDRRKIPARFILMAGEQDAVSEDGFLSWSNVRKGKPRAAEYHLYYSDNPVTELMRPRDVVFLALRRDETMLVIVTPATSTMHNQLSWLFGLEAQQELAFSSRAIDSAHDAELDFAARYILDELGIEFEEPEAARLDELVEPFGLKFPPTRILSQLARDSLPHLSPDLDADEALIGWMDREEQLFRRIERRIVAERIAGGFHSGEEADVDGFLSFSLSVQNRRKARAGQALENHLEAIFRVAGLRYARGAATENRNKPDFLFPGQAEYHDASFPTANLTMLGAKSTLKDRWRQVLSEAERINDKHLLTLEPGISENQTDEMRAKRLQLILPRRLHETFRPAQRAWLMDLHSFLDLLRNRQSQVLVS